MAKKLKEEPTIRNLAEVALARLGEVHDEVLLIRQEFVHKPIHHDEAVQCVRSEGSEASKKPGKLEDLLQHIMDNPSLDMDINTNREDHDKAEGMDVDAPAPTTAEAPGTAAPRIVQDLSDSLDIPRSQNTATKLGRKKSSGNVKPSEPGSSLGDFEGDSDCSFTTSTQDKAKREAAQWPPTRFRLKGKVCKKRSGPAKASAQTGTSALAQRIYTQMPVMYQGILNNERNGKKAASRKRKVMTEDAKGKKTMKTAKPTNGITRPKQKKKKVKPIAEPYQGWMNGPVEELTLPFPLTSMDKWTKFMKGPGKEEKIRDCMKLMRQYMADHHDNRFIEQPFVHTLFRLLFLAGKISVMGTDERYLHWLHMTK